MGCSHSLIIVMHGLAVFSLLTLAVSAQAGGQISAIPGVAGRDYPNFDRVPESSFSCLNLSPGYYSDPETECQAYHRCTHGNDGSMWTAAQLLTSTPSMMITRLSLWQLGDRWD